jgi:hypothetical protein
MAHVPTHTGGTDLRGGGESLVANLCQEIQGLRQRSLQLRDGLARCQDAPLRERLRRERSALQARQRELQRSVSALAAHWQGEPLSLAFLLELSRRPLAG